jgi:hypothetical protein
VTKVLDGMVEKLTIMKRKVSIEQTGMINQ